VVARANHHVAYPARFQLIAAMNPCRCGQLDDPGLAGSRAPRCATDYQARLSGPLLDRIVRFVDVPAVSAADLALPSPAEGSTEVAARVASARALQTARYAGTDVFTNAEADGKLLDSVAMPDADGILITGFCVTDSAIAYSADYSFLKYYRKFLIFQQVVPIWQCNV
jgi:magnesium chelatase family protein